MASDIIKGWVIINVATREGGQASVCVKMWSLSGNENLYYKALHSVTLVQFMPQELKIINS